MKFILPSLQHGEKLRLGRFSPVTSMLLVATCGCSRAPVFNILGSYFPSWLVCLAIAIGLTFLAHWFFTKAKLVEQLWPLPMVYPALVCLFSCILWLVCFE